MDYFNTNNTNNTNNDYKKIIIGSVIFYVPLIVFNVLIYNSINNIDNLLNTQDNIDYIHKIKTIIDNICKNVITC